MIKEESKREPVWDGKKDQKNHVVLSSSDDFAKYYDEISHPHLHNIAERKHCWHHKWKNASLAWMKGDWHIDIGLKKHIWPIHPEYEESLWPGSLIRFCVKCKQIDCIHYFGKHVNEKVYEVRKDELTGFIVVLKCEICSRRIRVWQGGSWQCLP